VLAHAAALDAWRAGKHRSLEPVYLDLSQDAASFGANGAK